MWKNFIKCILRLKCKVFRRKGKQQEIKRKKLEIRRPEIKTLSLTSFMTGTE